MQRVICLEHEFVEYLPSDVKDGKIYVTMAYATAVHKCCCGCGNKVFTPFTPTDWKLTFDGESVSLSPSVGNWGFSCQSHYWVRSGRVKWSGKWSKEEVEAGRTRDLEVKRDHYSNKPDSNSHNETSAEATPRKSFWHRFKSWFH